MLFDRKLIVHDILYSVAHILLPCSHRRSKAHPSVTVPRFGATLDPPSSPPPVRVTIAGPMVVSDCADLVLNGFGSSGIVSVS